MSHDPERLLGTIGVHNLRIDCIVGVYPQERHEPQPVYIDVEMDTPFPRSEAIDDTVDYNHISGTLRELAERRRFFLLETFAQEGAAELLLQFPAARRVRLEIRKPGAIAAATDAYVRVELHGPAQGA